MNTTMKEQAIILASGIPTVIGIAASTALMPGWHGRVLGVIIAVGGMAFAVLTVKRIR